MCCFFSRRLPLLLTKAIGVSASYRLANNRRVVAACHSNGGHRCTKKELHICVPKRRGVQGILVLHPQSPPVQKFHYGVMYSIYTCV
ncbi:hypothetical protein GDO81_010958 [Engystomops pustulosus]|uniref:Secreted protein n=1 Tax=Engystomops pustulosus TaxID=76066 RepID=A0AAV7C3S7_ENGPU|nr:hypothetical protein GDO81_010958 [Engystomops pustulosus]